ncbi:ABC transporter ATP-binding protein [Burkholderia sp. Bp8963]|uniref:ABC transporter ATP-binding protein n=1 Tax=Burkholderia sp. Bp8963 TaxID=2184547 RepID=UPI000F5B73DB|nr:ABC transporter ATP-binding protein [Burkholderia sp. Bp8963]RQS70488.1 ABC transporter ATP-binding protein [Burkholderia sp. Bp8963]
MRSITPCAARLVDVDKQYQAGNQQIRAVRRVSLEIPSGTFWMVTGPSGCGKSTLLNLLGCVDAPDAGDIEIDGQSIARLPERQLTRFRREKIGFIFQSFNLVPVLSAQENVEYPLRLLGLGRSERVGRAQAALDMVGLGRERDRRPGELSGGQQQRVAIARALVKEPSLVLADEPTANLDSATSAEVVALMRSMQRSSRTTFVFSTHDSELLGEADIVAYMKDGGFDTASGVRPYSQPGAGVHAAAHS